MSVSPESIVSLLTECKSLLLDLKNSVDQLSELKEINKQTQQRLTIKQPESYHNATRLLHALQHIQFEIPNLPERHRREKLVFKLRQELERFLLEYETGKRLCPMVFRCSPIFDESWLRVALQSIGFPSSVYEDKEHKGAPKTAIKAVLVDLSEELR